MLTGYCLYEEILFIRFSLKKNIGYGSLFCFIPKYEIGLFSSSVLKFYFETCNRVILT